MLLRMRSANDLTLPDRSSIVQDKMANVILTDSDFATVYEAVFRAQRNWRPLGERLGVEGFRLGGLRGKDDENLRDMVTLWLKKRDKKPTWAKLVAALRHETVNERGVADDLITNYLGGIDPEREQPPPIPDPVDPIRPPGKLDQTPTLADFTYLQNSDGEKFVNVIREVGAQWTALVGYFQLPANTSGNIQAKPGFGPAMACAEVFDTWLKGGSSEYRQPKTWKTVLTGIERVLGDHTVADKIRVVLTT